MISFGYYCRLQSEKSEECWNAAVKNQSISEAPVKMFDVSEAGGDNNEDKWDDTIDNIDYNHHPEECEHYLLSHVQQ